VRHAESGHNDPFVGHSHAQTFWLPYLWNIEPAEYEDFLELCTVAAELEAEQDFRKLAVIESELREKHWYWASSTLPKFIEEEIYSRKRFPRRTRKTQNRIDDLVDAAVRLVWRTIDDAKHAQTPEDDPKLTCLYPKIAVFRAIDTILREEQSDGREG
jgi:hypothetical protein